MYFFYILKTNEVKFLLEKKRKKTQMKLVSKVNMCSMWCALKI